MEKVPQMLPAEHPVCIEIFNSDEKSLVSPIKVPSQFPAISVVSPTGFSKDFLEELEGLYNARTINNINDYENGQKQCQSIEKIFEQHLSSTSPKYLKYFEYIGQ